MTNRIAHIDPDFDIDDLAELDEAAIACGFDQLAEAAKDYPELPEPSAKYPMWHDPSDC